MIDSFLMICQMITCTKLFRCSSCDLMQLKTFLPSSVSASRDAPCDKRNLEVKFQNFYNGLSLLALS